ncbi:molybdenum cofactor sulfurase [Cavenderia fasciculata]|uniref:Molybdenum cofactor sulfurase n=1 Tax=Cavenderia fasciculata TaxID=261658 RepID=F4PU48_CACFS|nr:molybdenum cofactor sulfurase [Cavenderia fasciculata]EGG20974.1 molybdenum cofactor sulfurase [Cavenderia fasciculata]|eukprot:XP_004358824.1 molybdenum cofactor sulfurase [Cavenderia fasciculata]
MQLIENIIAIIVVLSITYLYRKKQQRQQQRDDRSTLNKQTNNENEPIEMIQAKQEFIDRYSNSYGYDNTIDTIRNEQFSQLNGTVPTDHLGDCVYLDHTASTLYSKTQLQRVMEELQKSMFSNPHSQNPIGLNTTEQIELARGRILKYFNAPYKQYSVIFTSGCTDGLKKVGEYFPWKSSSTFYYSLDSHNSLVGIREYASEKGSSFQAIPSSYFKKSGNSDNIISAIKNGQEKNNQQPNTFDLLAFPAQCNHNGSKYNLDLILKVKKQLKNVKILLDIASFVGTSTFDLTEYPVDFASLSFYKLFGYPTGLGALIVRNDCFDILEKVYFSGGTVNASLASERFHAFRENNSQKFEDGTVDYLGIVSLKHGFDILENLGMDNISKHTFSLIQYAKEQMSEMVHASGIPLVTIYTDNHYQSSLEQGGIINFNISGPSGQLLGFNEVEKLASLRNIFIRTGCFCNPGACHGYLGLSKKDIINHLDSGHVCWDDKDIIDGKLTGSLRVSVGYMSNFNDIYVCLKKYKRKYKKFLKFLKDTFLNNDYTLLKPINQSNVSDVMILSEINLYPVKSFGPCKVDSWEIGPSGLLFDREWTLVDQNGVYINQKKLPILSLITTRIDLQTRMLVLEAPEMSTLEIPLDYYPVSSMDLVQVCGDSISGLLYGKEDFDKLGINISEWMYKFTCKSCHLVRKSPDSHRISRLAFLSNQQQQQSNNSNSSSSSNQQQQQSQPQTCKTSNNKNEEISFSNESPFLLISQVSVDDLRERVVERNKETSSRSDWAWITNESFRANFVVTGGKPYQESNLTDFKIGSLSFRSIGHCNRCKMICINQAIGVEEREPLATLATYRRSQGKIVFGQHLQFLNGDDEKQNDKIIVSINSIITTSTIVNSE